MISKVGTAKKQKYNKNRWNQKWKLLYFIIFFVFVQLKLNLFMTIIIQSTIITVLNKLMHKLTGYYPQSLVYVFFLLVDPNLLFLLKDEGGGAFWGWIRVLQCYRLGEATDYNYWELKSEERHNPETVSIISLLYLSHHYLTQKCAEYWDFWESWEIWELNREFKWCWAEKDSNLGEVVKTRGKEEKSYWKKGFFRFYFLYSIHRTTGMTVRLF